MPALPRACEQPDEKVRLFAPTRVHVAFAQSRFAPTRESRLQVSHQSPLIKRCFTGTYKASLVQREVARLRRAGGIEMQAGQPWRNLKGTKDNPSVSFADSARYTREPKALPRGSVNVRALAPFPGKSAVLQVRTKPPLCKGRWRGSAAPEGLKYRWNRLGEISKAQRTIPPSALLTALVAQGRRGAGFIYCINKLSIYCLF